MNAEISGYRKQIMALQKELQQLLDNCKHNFEPYTPYNPKDEWFSSGTQCTECGKHGGWYCHTSPTKLCEYDYSDHMNDYCIHCGLSDERK